MVFSSGNALFFKHFPIFLSIREKKVIDTHARDIDNVASFVAIIF
jgi:hypothetical protein